MKPTIYIDQNILGYLIENSIYIPDDILQIVFSETHFKEFPHKDYGKYCRSLDDFKARCLRINLNEKFEILNQATLLDYVSVESLYKNYLARTDNGFSEKIFDEFLARIAGADNFQEAIKVPDQLKKMNSEIVMDLPFSELSITRANLVFDELRDTMSKHLNQVQSTEENRKKMNTDKGKLGNIVGGNIIKEIGEHIKSQIECDILALVDNYINGKPTYLKIVVLHSFLNMAGYHADTKLSSTRKIPNIRYDGEHIAYGAFCNYILSEDRRLVQKAGAIYQYLNMGTSIIHLNRINVR